ncbi:MAG: heme-binding domain-containing protein [Ignavibacteriaceae bacterium]|nr:heme-binding domain-containing protein [Ignavibacteriaceae bacterium]
MKKILLALVVILIGIQFIPVERTNPPIRRDISAPDNISTILRASCYDCHSNETVWPWYSKIAPVSFLVAGDVNDGRKHLNFSEWDKYEDGKREKILEEIVEEVEKENMPLTIYTFTHPSAKLDPFRINLLKDWVNQGSSKEKSLRYEK